METLLKVRCVLEVSIQQKRLPHFALLEPRTEQDGDLGVNSLLAGFTLVVHSMETIFARTHCVFLRRACGQSHRA